METADRIHKFEAAGLGKAPFRECGFSKNVYSACPGHSQPGGTCDYCGTGIMYEVHVESADGRKFKVGTDCAQKVGDEGLRRAAKQYENEHARKVNAARREKRRESEAAKRIARVAAARERLPLVADKLDEECHPCINGKSMLDYVNWLLDHSAGEKACAIIENA